METIEHTSAVDRAAFVTQWCELTAYSSLEFMIVSAFPFA